MAITSIGIGSAPNDGTGDDLRTAFGTVNSNFSELDERTAGWGSHASAPASSAYVDSAGDVGIGTTSPGAQLEVEDMNGNIYAVLIDVNDMGDVANEYGLFIDVDVADFSPTANRTHHGARVTVDSAATTPTQANGDREYLYGTRVEATGAGEQYQITGDYVIGKHTATAYDIQNLYSVYGVSDAAAASGSTTVATIRAVQGLGTASGAAATVTNLTAGYFEADCTGSGAVVQNAYGVYSFIDHNAGTINTAYQFYGITTGTVGTSWGLYSTGAAKSEIQGAAAGSIPLTVLAASASFTSDVLAVNTNTAAGTGFDLITATTDADGTPDVEFRVRGDGQVTADGSFTGGGADYAEMFEWADGNPDNHDRVGWSVMLAAGGKIRRATGADAAADILGVVSAAPATLGDAAPLRWGGKYLTDAFGRPILEAYEVLSWTETVQETVEELRKTGKILTRQVAVTDAAGKPRLDDLGRPIAKEIREPEELVVEVQRPRRIRHEYPADRVPAGVNVPEDAVRTPRRRRRLSGRFNPALPYKPRELRPEWSAVGLVGKLRLRVGEPTGARWLKLRDISETVEEWLVR